jgi:peptide/nickel transport system substrate-binding protein/oligopeptide transport system substrate-binding protein
MTEFAENRPNDEGLPKRCASVRRRAFLIPGALLILFLLTAFATRLVKRDGLRANLEAGADVGSNPVRGGVFRYPLLAPIHTLDPAKAVFSMDVMLIQQLYDGLTAFDRHLNVVPAIAKFWEISPDGKTYTFELREDARFHNGRRVTAEDCVFSFERLLTKGLNEHNFHYFSRIEGAEAFHEGKAKHVKGLRALDETTFQIRFLTPFVPALSVLSMYSSKILPKEELLSQGDRFFEAPIGTGAFQFARWIDASEDPAVPLVDGVRQGIRLEANLQYFEGRPYLDAIVFRALWNSKDHEGEAHPLHEVADCLDTNEVDHYADWVPIEADRLLALRYLYFPNQVHPYDDPRVRRAINYALDKRSFLDAHRITEGSPAATGVVPPGIPGFVPKGSTSGQDLEKARTLLAEAGYPGGKGLPPLELPVMRGGIYPRDPASKARDGCLVACLSKVGVEVRLVEVNRILPPEDPAFRGHAVIRDNTWYADFPDPDNFLRPLFHSQGYMNAFGYSNRVVDRLLDQVWSETSYTARNKLYHHIEELILRDAPIIPTDYGRVRYLLRPNVRGFYLTPLGAPYLKMKDIWLAQEGPTREVDL